MRIGFAQFAVSSACVTFILENITNLHKSLSHKIRHSYFFKNFTHNMQIFSCAYHDLKCLKAIYFSCLHVFIYSNSLNSHLFLFTKDQDQFIHQSASIWIKVGVEIKHHLLDNQQPISLETVDCPITLNWSLPYPFPSHSSSGCIGRLPHLSLVNHPYLFWLSRRLELQWSTVSLISVDRFTPKNFP